MPVSRNRKTHKAKAAKRRQEHELKRHKTQAFAAKLNEMLKQEAEGQNQNAGPITAALPSFEIFNNMNSII
jgi:hypothetical protein